MAELPIGIDFDQYLIVQLMVQRGAILMTPEQTVKLIKILTEKRAELRLSTNEVARRAHLDPVAVWRIEQGKVAKPRAESLIAIGRALDINPVELFTIVGWLTGDDMPSLGTYLSAKFSNPPDAVVRHIEHHVTKILHAYSHSAGHRHNTADTETCQWCIDHSGQQQHNPSKGASG